MSRQHPAVDPDGLLEYSVVFTDRSLNHMSQRFQGVMRDISDTLKRTYDAAAVALVPGGGTYGMEAIARQFAGGRKCLVVRNGYFSLPLEPDLRDRPDPVGHGRTEGGARGAGASASPGRPRRWRTSSPPSATQQPDLVFAPARGYFVGHHPAGRLPPRAGRGRARARRPVRPRLRRVRHGVGGHAASAAWTSCSARHRRGGARRRAPPWSCLGDTALRADR